MQGWTVPAPVEPGTFPLANGAAGRVGRLRGYGNAINAEAATQFIKAYLEQKQAA
jgi:DNA (cytosine-5)-methyltransferase 1